MRPLASVATVVVLLALGLAIDNLAARHNVLMPLMWAQAIVARNRLRLVVAGSAIAVVLAPSGAARELNRMTPAITLSIYISRQFAAALTAMLLALTGLVALFDFLELLRRSVSKPDATFGLVSEIEALRLPYISMQILPFAVLLGGIMCFWRLTRSSELIVARAAGVSAWEFLAAPTFCALLFGVVAVTVGTPLSSIMLARAEVMDNTYLRTGGGPLALDGGQLWLRQSDRALTPQGVAIIHARGRANCTAGNSRQAESACSVWTATIGCWRGSKRPVPCLAREAGTWWVRATCVLTKCQDPCNRSACRPT